MDNNDIDILLRNAEQGTATEEQMAQADALLTEMEKRMEERIDEWAASEQTASQNARTIPMRWIIGIAASLLLILSVTIYYQHEYVPQDYAQHQSKDTFDNPEDAAAETQRALLKFSQVINKAIE